MRGHKNGRLAHPADTVALPKLRTTGSAALHSALGRAPPPVPAQGSVLGVAQVVGGHVRAHCRQRGGAARLHHQVQRGGDHFGQHVLLRPPPLERVAAVLGRRRLVEQVRVGQLRGARPRGVHRLVGHLVHGHAAHGARAAPRLGRLAAACEGARGPQAEGRGQVHHEPLLAEQGQHGQQVLQVRHQRAPHALVRAHQPLQHQARVPH
mmetsp:Transcript_32189/g.81813  ORF Transcript_32189/g.81813 Transcript_32189/m.81813 type:complete len:208 (-) Transcript_32189:1139-1762(-)